MLAPAPDIWPTWWPRRVRIFDWWPWTGLWPCCARVQGGRHHRRLPSPLPRRIVGDSARLPLRSACCDLAVATFSFHTWNDPVLGVQEMRRIVKPGGQAWIYEMNREAVWQHWQGLAREEHLPTLFVAAGFKLLSWNHALRSAEILLERLHRPDYRDGNYSRCITYSGEPSFRLVKTAVKTCYQKSFCRDAGSIRSFLEFFFGFSGCFVTIKRYYNAVSFLLF